VGDGSGGGESDDRPPDQVRENVVAGTGPQPSPRRRRGVLRWTLAIVYTLIGSCCVCGSLVAVQALLGGGSPATTRAPITGSVVVLPWSYPGIAVAADIIYSDPNGLCRGPKLTVTETDTEVALSLTESDGLLFACGRGQSEDTPESVTIAKPLGTRRLVDALTGDPVPYFDGRQPLYLPPAQAGGSLYGIVTSYAPFFGGSGAGVMVETYTFYPKYYLLASPLDSAGYLQIVQVTGGGWNPPAGVATVPVTVHGHPGLAASGIVVWTESQETVAVIGGQSGHAVPQGVVADSDPLTTVQLLDVANSLIGGQR
jgi:hypothetical protein